MSDTPETDAQIFDACDGQGCEAVLAGFARKLERERNDALNKAHNYEQGYLTHAARADTLEKERNSLQDQRDFAMGEIERLRKEYFEMLDSAWGLIANAGGGNWDLQTEPWRQAAICFRNWYLSTSASSEEREMEAAK